MKRLRLAGDGTLLPAVTVVLVAVVLHGVVLLTSSRLGVAPITKLADTPRLNYTLQSLPAIPALEPAFVVRALGNAARSVAPSPAPTPLRDRPEPTPPGGEDATPPGEPDAPSPTPPPGLPILPTSDLRVSLSADRDVASRGDDIVFLITVTNVGQERSTEAWTIESHTPVGTTGREIWLPESEGCQKAERATQLDTPWPGAGDQAHIPTYSSRQRIESGADCLYAFRVTVNPWTSAGTRLHNHAHLMVAGRGTQTTGDAFVTVR